MTDKNTEESSLFDKIRTKLNDLTTLEIKTIIGDHTVDAKGKVKIDTSDNADVIFTIIDLLDGDFSIGFNPKFLQEPYSAIKEYHAAREQEGKDIIKKNIETLEALLKLVVNVESMSNGSDTDTPGGAG